ncbi:uncharacterized protein EAF02_006371 [Botrytis sinoallii]|uniref:uncharacterized protein n=1 Tax=Botrytis sinoallii TaxID=1463999 RepID=UPI001901FFC3|nr:uncharacterized protein EAF02_006371 [Botrytis sinoallii]KAF7881683.1 hypothetical protein EAF02_006371 [Botrytis sinoallii]
MLLPSSNYIQGLCDMHKGTRQGKMSGIQREAVTIYGTTHSSCVVNLALVLYSYWAGTLHTQSYRPMRLFGLTAYSSYYGKTHIITDHERVIACFQKPANKQKKRRVTFIVTGLRMGDGIVLLSPNPGI